MPKKVTLATVVALGMLFAPATAGASRGVAIDIGRIEISQALERGGSYKLPVVGVSNPGSERAMYEMHVAPVEGERVPPQRWFTFEPARFALAPRATRAVKVRLTVPTGADPASYTGLVGAALRDEGRGTRVGAAAAARISFTVAPSSSLEAWWLWVKRHIRRHAPWTYLVPVLLAGALAVRRLRRSYSLRIVHRA